MERPFLSYGCTGSEGEAREEGEFVGNRDTRHP